MTENRIQISNESIENLINTIRNKQVMIDRDLAELYAVETKRLNEQVKRNIDRFPNEFRFQLDNDEKNELVANCDRFEKLKHSSVNPYAFTEQGVAMLASVLRSDIAVKVSIQIINAFVNMRRFLVKNANVFQRLDSLELRQLKTDNKIEKVLQAIDNKKLIPMQGIFFDGQVFDAFNFISDLIRSAKTSIVLIDNYIDDSVIANFANKQKRVKIKILTNRITKPVKIAVKKFNDQYGNMTIHNLKQSHDRFMIIDNDKVYHIGASLKDLGKKWFAFSKISENSVELLKRIAEVDE
ncbi:MAG: ORF6N domain-containing protein [Fidelibacterota bacterium]